MHYEQQLSSNARVREGRYADQMERDRRRKGNGISSERSLFVRVSHVRTTPVSVCASFENDQRMPLRFVSVSERTTYFRDFIGKVWILFERGRRKSASVPVLSVIVVPDVTRWYLIFPFATDRNNPIGLIRLIRWIKSIFVCTKISTGGLSFLYISWTSKGMRIS